MRFMKEKTFTLTGLPTVPHFDIWTPIKFCTAGVHILHPIQTFKSKVGLTKE
jgi:hypothetical protein